jgi:hypothetical protein
MSQNKLFKELCKPETLRIGWHLAQADSRDDFVLDPVSYEDFASNLTERLSYLLREVSHERYRPSYLLEMDIPKSGLAIRPGNVLPIDESALLHSIIYVVAPRLDRKLSDSVYSYRLGRDWEKRVKKGRSMFREADDEIPFLRGTTIRKIDPIEPWYIAWPEFDRERIDAVKKRGYTHLTRTDIAAYFENIDLDLLHDILRQIIPSEPVIVSLLLRLLDSWTRTSATGISIRAGIPQGNDVSSFLGNIYLLPLDRALAKFCARARAYWLRYVDDVEVYTKRERDARDVVFVINEALRRLFLNLQGAKTEILSGRRLEQQLMRAESEVLDSAMKQLERLDPTKRQDSRKISLVLDRVKTTVARFRKNLPGSVRTLSSRDSRTLRRAMTLWGYAHRPYLLRAALEALGEPPEYRMLQKCLRYMSLMPPKYHDQISDELLQLLDDQVPLLPYHAAEILRALRQLHPSSARLNLTKSVTRIGFARRSQWPVRQQALQLLAILPAREETALKRANASLAHHHPFVRRAALLMLARTGVQTLRDKIDRLIYDPDSAVSRLAGHWWRIIHESDYALSELNRLRQGRNDTDSRFVWTIPKLWVLRASPDPAIVKGLRKHLDIYRESQSARVRYHLRLLDRQTLWTAKS